MYRITVLMFLFLPTLTVGQNVKNLTLYFDGTPTGLPQIDSTLSPIFIDLSKLRDTIVVVDGSYSLTLKRISRSQISSKLVSKDVEAEGVFYILPKPAYQYVHFYDANEFKLILKREPYYEVVRQGKWKVMLNGKISIEDSRFKIID